jgi:hypothetical protein
MMPRYYSALALIVGGTLLLFLLRIALLRFDAITRMLLSAPTQHHADHLKSSRVLNSMCPVVFYSM